MLGAYLDLLQVFVAQVLQGVDEVLLDLYVQGVLDLGQALHRLPCVEQGVACGRGGVRRQTVTGGLGFRGQDTPTPKQPHTPRPGTGTRIQSKGPYGPNLSHSGRGLAVTGVEQSVLPCSERSQVCSEPAMAWGRGGGGGRVPRPGKPRRVWDPRSPVGGRGLSGASAAFVLGLASTRKDQHHGGTCPPHRRGEAPVLSLATSPRQPAGPSPKLDSLPSSFPWRIMHSPSRPSDCG